MVCFLLVCAFVLLLISLWLERSWVTVFVVFLFLAFFVVLLLGSLASLSPRDSVIDINSYKVCYQKIVNLDFYRQGAEKVGNWGQCLLDKLKSN